MIQIFFFFFKIVHTRSIPHGAHHARLLWLNLIFTRGKKLQKGSIKRVPRKRWFTILGPEKTSSFPIIAMIFGYWWLSFLLRTCSKNIISATIKKLLRTQMIHDAYCDWDNESIRSALRISMNCGEGWRNGGMKEKGYGVWRSWGKGWMMKCFRCSRTSVRALVR